MAIYETRLGANKRPPQWDLLVRCGVGNPFTKSWSTIPKPGHHPNYWHFIAGTTLSERKSHSRSSRRVPGHSRSNSRNSKFHSRNTKFHSRNGIPRLEQYENHNSRRNSRSDSRKWWEPTWKIFICPSILRALFFKLGWSPLLQKMGAFFGIYCMNRPSNWLWLEPNKARKMGKLCTVSQPNGPAEVQCDFFGPISGLNFGRC